MQTAMCDGRNSEFERASVIGADPSQRVLPRRRATGEHKLIAQHSPITDVGGTKSANYGNHL
jgi:hypothetical protein